MTSLLPTPQNRRNRVIMSTLDRSPYTHRSATWSGNLAITQAANVPTSQAAPSSTPSSLAGTLPADREPEASPKSCPVTPELLYSQVVHPAPAMGSGFVARPLDSPASSNDGPNEFALRRADESPADGLWTTVTRKTALTHRERSASPTSKVSNKSTVIQSDETSPLLRAANDLSSEQLRQLARRYNQMASAREGSQINSESERSNQSTQNSGMMNTSRRNDERTSRAKGKGVDPRNWGGVDFSENFSEADFEAQREALDNYSGINRVIKHEEIPPPTGFFDSGPLIDLGSTGPSSLAIVSSKTILNKDGSASGQTKSEKIASLKREISVLEQENIPKPPKKVSLNRAEHAMRANIVDNIHKDKRAKSSSQAPVKPGKGRLPFGSSLEQAIRDSGPAVPPSDPSDSSSSPSSHNEPDENDADDERRTCFSSTGDRARSRSKKTELSEKNTRMLIKPVEPTKYNGTADAEAYHRFVREGSAYVKAGRVPVDEQPFYLSYFLTIWVAPLHPRLLVQRPVNIAVVHITKKLSVLRNLHVNLQHAESERSGKKLKARHSQMPVYLVVCGLSGPFKVRTKALEARFENHGEDGGEVVLRNACNIICNGPRNLFSISDKLGCKCFRALMEEGSTADWMKEEKAQTHLWCIPHRFHALLAGVVMTEPPSSVAPEVVAEDGPAVAFAAPVGAELPALADPDTVSVVRALFAEEAPAYSVSAAVAGLDLRLQGVPLSPKVTVAFPFLLEAFDWALFGGIEGERDERETCTWKLSQLKDIQQQSMMCRAQNMLYITWIAWFPLLRPFHSAAWSRMPGSQAGGSEGCGPNWGAAVGVEVERENESGLLPKREITPILVKTAYDVLKIFHTTPMLLASEPEAKPQPVGTLPRSKVTAIFPAHPNHNVLFLLLSQATGLVSSSVVDLPRKLNTPMCGPAYTLQREDVRKLSVEWWTPGILPERRLKLLPTLAYSVCGQVPRGSNRRFNKMASQFTDSQCLVLIDPLE
ncbi:hypothetical protein C8J57DRAFT_1234043 [Mycena rebaudengoi]|nr:hypothetical protein C8J57DRAFT_1234043 [Mycena rebaudengoi]